MSHLKRTSSGHLAKNASGHLVKACDACFGDYDCSACNGTVPSFWTIQLSGISFCADCLPAFATCAATGNRWIKYSSDSMNSEFIFNNPNDCQWISTQDRVGTVEWYWSANMGCDPMFSPITRGLFSKLTIIGGDDPLIRLIVGSKYSAVGNADYQLIFYGEAPLVACDTQHEMENEAACGLCAQYWDQNWYTGVASGGTAIITPCEVGI